jgi:hypothetical protein
MPAREPEYEELNRRLWRLVQAQDKRLEGNGQALVKSLIATLHTEGYAVSLSTERQLTEYLDQVQAELRSAIASATKLGEPATMRDELVAKLTEEAFTAQWPDGMTLSQRLWGFRQNFRHDFVDVLKRGARQGKAVDALIYDLQRSIESQAGNATFQIAHNLTEDWATELAQAGKDLLTNPAVRKRWNELVNDAEVYLQDLSEAGTKHAAQTVFKKLKAAVESGNAEAIDEAVAWWMYDKQLYLLKRIARTEMATAQHRAVIASAIDDPDVIGFQWRLSSTHPAPDICDYYASIDMGLGKGVWTKEAVPMHKAHPHCMCLLIPRVTPVRQAGVTNYGEFLRNVTPERQKQLMPAWARNAIGKVALDQLIRPDGFGLITKEQAIAQFGAGIFGPR